MFKQGAFINILTPDSRDWKEAFEIVCGFPELDHIELWVEHIPQGNHLAEIKSVFGDFPLIIHGPFIHASMVSHVQKIVEATQERCEATMEFASRIGAQVVTFHAGTYPVFLSKDEALETLARRFDRFARMTSPIATLENMPVALHGTARQPIGHLSDCEQMLSLLPHLRFTLDIGHCIQNEDDFVSFLQRHAERIEDIHLHDAIPKGRGHLKLGSGTLDLKLLLSVLTQVSYSKYMSLETISMSDTQSSWKVLLAAEAQSGTQQQSPPLSQKRVGGLRHR